MLKWNSEADGPKRIHRLPPAQIIILGFFAVISLGALLLTLPISSNDRVFTNPITAYFTATSATCVTGLVPVDTELYWSGFGQGVILCLIQIGGLGVMSMAMMFSILLNRRVSPRERVIFAQSMNLFSGEKMFPFIKSMLKFTFAFEGLGALLLSFKFIPIFGWDGIFKSIFHSVSAFCNAGFDILGKSGGEFTNLGSFADDWYVNIIICSLIVFGGLGFVVWYDILKAIKERKRLMLYSKMVLSITTILLVGGTLLFCFSEWNNPDSIADCSVGGKILRCIFFSVTCRTAGFATFNLSGLHGISKAGAMALMFIGGSSGSTAGGIKTVTMGIILISIFQITRGNKDINIRKHRVENEVVLRAFALFVISGIALFICSFVLNFTETGFTEKGFDFIDLAFEAFSAFGTVGLTIGITPYLSVAGQIMIMALMFFGRIGITTITYAILMSLNSEKQAFRYPKANILIG